MCTASWGDVDKDPNNTDDSGVTDSRKKYQVSRQDSGQYFSLYNEFFLGPASDKYRLTAAQFDSWVFCSK